MGNTHFQRAVVEKNLLENRTCSIAASLWSKFLAALNFRKETLFTRDIFWRNHLCQKLQLSNLNAAMSLSNVWTKTGAWVAAKIKNIRAFKMFNSNWYLQ